MSRITFHIEKLVETCKNQKNLYIYGAGQNARHVYHFLERREIKAKGFVVTKMSGNPETLYGCNVITVDQLSSYYDYQILVPFNEGGKTFKEIWNHLIENQIHNAYFFTHDLLDYIKEEELFQKVKSVFNTTEYQLGENIPVENEHSIFIMKGSGGEEYHWRFRNMGINEQTIKCISDVFPGKSAIEEFEEQYGRYHVLHAAESLDVNQKKVCAVYMAYSHVDKPVEQAAIPSWVIPIQVGAALTDRNICKVKDNIGDNISERNGIYSECTALYWMWKNAPQTDYIGLCHYRRRFNIEENDIGQIGALGLDVLVTAPTFVNETIEKFFSFFTPETDMEMLLKAIRKIWPEYTLTAEKFLVSRFFPPCNLFVMKYELFQEYMQFVFSITFEIEHFYDEIGFYRRDRYMGYLIECLLGIFLMKNKQRLKIGYTDMRFYS